MRRLLITALLLSLVALTSIAGACNNNINTLAPTDGKSDMTNTSPISISSDSNKENTTQILENNILIRLSTNKNTYVPGEIILATASVENLSPNSVEYKLSSLGDPTPYVYLETNQYFTRFALEEKELGGRRTVQPMVTSGQLRPHETVTREVIWNQMIGFKNQQAPQGTYRIGCGITLGDYQNESSLKTMSVNLDFNIVGAPEWITPEQAMDTALNLPEVRTWRESHSGKNVTKEENGFYFVFINDEWQKVSSQFTISESSISLNLDNLRQWIPGASVNLEDGKWIIRMGTKLGPNPHFAKIQIDPVTGSVIYAQFSDRVPL